MLGPVFGDVRHARMNQTPGAAKGGLQPGSHIFFNHIERDRRQKLTVGQDIQAFNRTRNARKPFNMIIPWCQVFIADRPINRNTFPGIGLEIDRCQAITLPPPQQRAPTDVIPADPGKGFDLGIRAITLVGIHGHGTFTDGHSTIEYRLDGLGQLVAMGKIPGLFAGIDVISDVFNISATFKHQYLESFFGQLLGSPAATDSRSNDNGIIMVLIVHHGVSPGTITCLTGLETKLHAH